MKSIVGKILYNRYRIVQYLSQNDWGTVYLAEDLASNKAQNSADHSPQQCQIEQLQPQYNHEVLGAQSWQKVLKTFVAQGNILIKVSQHPQIPQLLAFFECDREFYLVREYIQGITLEQKLQDTLINEAEVLSWLQEILGVLESIHELDMAHLNIQPSSLIQDREGKKFLTNFAAIKNAILFDNQELKRVLNPDFFPQGEPLPSDFAADIYALGKTMIFALTGELSASIQANSTQVTSHNLTNLNNAPKANIRPELAGILNKMVDREPDHSYQSATEVLNELDFKQQNVVTFPSPFANGFRLPQTPSPPVVKPRNRLRTLWDSSKSLSFGRLIWVLLSLPFILASVIIFIGLHQNSEETFVPDAKYTNGDYQFSLKYPQTWSERQIEDPITGEIVVFTSPKETDADPFAEKVYIAVEHLSSEPTNLEQYRQTVLERINQSDSSNIKLYEDFPTKISQAPARTVIYSRQQGSLPLQQMESFTIKNNLVYIAIYTAERDKFAKFYPAVEKIIDSWEIK
jgi:eukaryotic-like serine/threonine-protein kinase